jgi:hypothetical protein
VTATTKITVFWAVAPLLVYQVPKYGNIQLHSCSHHHRAAKSSQAVKDTEMSLQGWCSAESCMLPSFRRILLPPSSWPEVCAQTLKTNTASSCELAVVYQSARRHILSDLTLPQNSHGQDICRIRWHTMAITEVLQ